jgi:hypothetical protein
MKSTKGVAPYIQKIEFDRKNFCPVILPWKFILRPSYFITKNLRKLDAQVPLGLSARLNFTNLFNKIQSYKIYLVLKKTELVLNSSMARYYNL